MDVLLVEDQPVVSEATAPSSASRVLLRQGPSGQRAPVDGMLEARSRRGMTSTPMPIAPSSAAMPMRI
jgi:hypothetical protein